MTTEKAIDLPQDARSKSREELESLDRDFGVNTEVEGLDDDPILPHRKRMLFLACACILGKPSCQSELGHCCCRLTGTLK
jgi:hypothetical protein